MIASGEKIDNIILRHAAASEHFNPFQPTANLNMRSGPFRGMVPKSTPSHLVNTLLMVRAKLTFSLLSRLITWPCLELIVLPRTILPIFLYNPAE